MLGLKTLAESIWRYVRLLSEVRVESRPTAQRSPVARKRRRHGGDGGHSLKTRLARITPFPRHFSPELVSIVLDFLLDDRAALHACACACSEWLPIARIRIYRNIHIKSPRRYLAWERFFDERPAIAPCVKRVILFRPENYRPTDDAELGLHRELPRILTKFPRMRNLQIDNWAGLELNQEYRESLSTSCARLTSLSLWTCEFLRGDLMRLLHASPNLRTLSMINVLARPDSIPSVYDPPTLRLDTLRIRDTCHCTGPHAAIHILNTVTLDPPPPSVEIGMPLHHEAFAQFLSKYGSSITDLVIAQLHRPHCSTDQLDKPRYSLTDASCVKTLHFFADYACLTHPGFVSDSPATYAGVLHFLRALYHYTSGAHPALHTVTLTLRAEDITMAPHYNDGFPRQLSTALGRFARARPAVCLRIQFGHRWGTDHDWAEFARKFWDGIHALDALEPPPNLTLVIGSVWELRPVGAQLCGRIWEQPYGEVPVVRENVARERLERAGREPGTDYVVSSTPSICASHRRLQTRLPDEANILRPRILFPHDP